MKKQGGKGMSKVTQLGKVELRHEPRQAVCPESRPHHHADGSSSRQPGPGTRLGLVYVDAL